MLGQTIENNNSTAELSDFQSILTFSTLNFIFGDRFTYNFHLLYNVFDIYDFMQDCNNSIASALELLQSCSKPSIY